MRFVRLWHGLLGVDKRTVIEDIDFDQEGADGVSRGARVRPGRGLRVAVAVVAGGRLGMTAVRVGAAGGVWIGVW